MIIIYFPFGILYFVLWWGFLTYHAIEVMINLTNFQIDLLKLDMENMEIINNLIVIFVAPNFIRSLCINFVSSNMHYFGDVEKGNVIKQTQIIDSWIFFPFHIFCFNFGKTHGLHHFWAADPFYIRQMLAKKVLPIMIENGVRVNDFANMARANRYAQCSDHAALHARV